MKTKDLVIVVAIAAIVASTVLFGGLLFFKEQARSVVGGASGTQHDNQEVFSDEVTLTGARNASGTTTGAGTVVTKEVCATLSTTTPAIATGATSSIPAFTLSGATSSQNQVYSFGYANNTTNTVGGLVGQVYPASTTGVVGVNLYNAGPANWGTGTNTFSVCYQQF